MERPWIAGQADARIAGRLDAPATRRNRAPILEVLRQYLPATGLVLELGSGSGQHLAWFAAALPGLTWQPSDPDAYMHASIAAWARQAGAANVRAPLASDICEGDWGLGETADELVAILAINTLQVAPRAACARLMRGAGRLLPAGGLLYLYGPFSKGGVHSAPSNQAFDRMLRAQHPDWAVPDLDDVAAHAEAEGLTLDETLDMPSNNLSVIIRRR